MVQNRSKTIGKPLAHGVGRRKNAVARAWLRRGSGKIMVNAKKLSDYFDVQISRLDAMKPLRVTPEASQYDVQVNVSGGGFTSQAGAVRLAVARAILQADESLRQVLKKNGLLTVDSRVKERKKYGQRGARRKFQFVKR
jgi:small subunit ribosomal protein S9